MNDGEDWKREVEEEEETGDDSTPPERRSVGYIRNFAIRLGKLLIAGRKAEYEQGAFVDEAFRGRYWERWPTAAGQTPSFAVWCDKVLGYRQRKAEYLRNNYLALRAIDPPEDLHYRALRLGWTKLAIVLRIAKSARTLEEWIDRIENYGMTEEEIDAEVRAAGAAAGRAGDPDKETEERDAAPPSGEDPPARRPKENVIFDDVEDLRLWTRARAVIKERFSITGKGRALGLLAANYLACLPATDEGGIESELAYVVHHIERTYGVKLALLAVPAPVGSGRKDKDAALEV